MPGAEGVVKTGGRAHRVLLVQKFSSLGGGQKSLVHHLELLDRSRFDPRVAVSNEGWLTRELARLEVPWVRLPLGHWTNPLSFPRTLYTVTRLIRILREQEIDLIHANEHWVAPPCGLAARRVGIPSICHFRTGLQDLTPARIRQYRYASFDRVIVVADVLREALVRHLPDAGKVVVVRDGVEPPAAAPRPRSPRQTRVAITVGAIYQVKGQAKILERALPWLRDSPRHFLLFVGGTRGDPAYLAGMRARVAAERLGRQVLFLGSRDDVPRLLAAADVLIAFSTVEGIPRVVTEAMFAGKPVLVSDTPGMAEVVVDGVVGRILDFDAPANPLAASLRSLSADPARWEAMGRSGRARALSRYSTRVMSEAIQAVYCELLERKGQDG